MADYSIALQFTPGIKRVFLRDLDGHAELSVQDAGSGSAMALLNCLVAARPSPDGHAPKAAELAIADRDILLAGIYAKTYGYRLDSTVNCVHCQLPFDLSFNLEDLVTHTLNSYSPVESRDGVFELADGVRFRLPTGEDELAVAGLPLQKASSKLLERCLVEGDLAAQDEAVQLAMEAIAPIMQTDLLARCPECGEEQPVHFDMQSFLLSRLRLEQNLLMQEIHSLAKTYHWGYQEILDLPRSSRKKYASMIEAEA